MGFLELRRQRSQASMSGQADRVIALESWEGLGPQDAFKKDSRGLSRVTTENPGVPQLVPVTSGSFFLCL